MGTPTDNTWNQDGLWTDIGKNPRANGCEKNQINLWGNSLRLTIDTLAVGFKPSALINENAMMRAAAPDKISSLIEESNSVRNSEFVRLDAIPR